MTGKPSARERLRNRVKKTQEPPTPDPIESTAKAKREPIPHHPGCNCKRCNGSRDEQALSGRGIPKGDEPADGSGVSGAKNAKGAAPKAGDDGDRDRQPRRGNAQPTVSRPKADNVSGRDEAADTGSPETNVDVAGRKPARSPGVSSPAVEQTRRGRSGGTVPRKAGSVKNVPRPKYPVAEGILIQDPSSPGVIFDGHPRVYSTCRDCGEKMQVVYPSDTVHPSCTPKPTVVESLVRGWLSAVEAGDEEAARLTEEEILKRDGQPPNLPAAALAYVDWGFHVFPLHPGTKDPATAHGVKDATTKRTWVAKWWKRNPQYNIGLATGYGFDALDVDPDKGGVESFQKLLESKRIPDVHGLVATSSGGLHLYLAVRGKSNRAGWMPGLDYRAIGGYVVAPPSRLGNDPARSWSWITIPSPVIKGGEF